MAQRGRVPCAGECFFLFFKSVFRMGEGMTHPCKWHLQGQVLHPPLQITISSCEKQERAGRPTLQMSFHPRLIIVSVVVPSLSLPRPLSQMRNSMGADARCGRKWAARGPAELDAGVDAKSPTAAAGGRRCGILSSSGWWPQVLLDLRFSLSRSTGGASCARAT